MLSSKNGEKSAKLILKGLLGHPVLEFPRIICIYKRFHSVRQIKIHEDGHIEATAFTIHQI